jgi:hypothetical protein
MLVDHERDGNDGKPLMEEDGSTCGKMAMPKTASFGPFQRIGRGKRDFRRSYFNRATPTSSLQNTLQATRLWSTSQMIVLGDAAACYALQSVSLRPLLANLQSTTLHASTA